MKKILHILIVLMFISSGLSAQNLTVSDDHGPIGPNDTVFYYGDINALIVSHVFITNNSTKPMDLRCVREEILIVPGSSNYFCWDQCFDPTIDTAGLVTLGAGSTNKNNFSGDYEAFGNLGKSYVRYKFYDDADPSDYTSILVEYNATGVGIPETNTNIELNVFPNPATTQANIGFEINTDKEVQIMISDIIGNTVYLSEGQIYSAGKNIVSVDLNEINPGMYFVKVLVDDKVFTKKLYHR